MSRLYRTPLVLLVLVSLIFASYWQFFVVKKAKANPPAPSINMSQPFYADSTKNTINFNMIVNSVAPGTLITATKDASITATTKFLTYGGALTFSITQEMPADFTAYALTSFNSRSGAKAYIFVQNDRIIKSGVFITRLPTGLLSSADGVALTNNTGAVAQISLLANNNNTVNFQNDPYWVTLTATGNGDPRVIAVSLNSTDQETACHTVGNNWDSLKADLRNLTIPKPGSALDQSANANWTVTTAVTAEGILAAFKDVLNQKQASMYWSLLGPLAQTIAQISQESNPDADTTIQAIQQSTLMPTAQGLNTMNDILNRANLIDQNLNNLIANNANCGSFGVKFRRFKYDVARESDTNVYASLTALKSDIAALVKVAQDNFDSLQAPVTTAGTLSTDDCGNVFSNVTGGISAIINGMFCGLGLVLNRAAAYLMQEAFYLLKAFIGVEVGIQPENVTQPAADVTGSASATATPTPTTPTTTGLNLVATITFSNQSRYNQLKASPTGVIVTIGQSGTNHRPTSTTFAGTASCANFNDPAKTAVCTITASQTLPSSTPTGAALGKIGSAEVFLINFTNLSTTATVNDLL